METAIKDRPILFSGPMVRAILDGRKTQTRRVVNGPIPDGATSCGVFLTRDETLNGRWQFLDGDPSDADSWGWIGEDFSCPYGKPGDRLWVRETFSPIPLNRPSGYFTDPEWIDRKYWYAADNDKPTWGGKWKPSIFMPRNASRITVEITDIRIEHLQEITESDAIAEGFEKKIRSQDFDTAVSEFFNLWETLNAKRGVCKTCKGHGVVPAWSGSLSGGSLMQDSKDCPDCQGKETGYGWDANPFVWVITFKRV